MPQSCFGSRHDFSAISVHVKIPDCEFVHFFVYRLFLDVHAQVLFETAWTHLDDGTDFVVLIHGLVARLCKLSDSVHPLNDVVVQLRDVPRDFRDRDLLHQGSLRLGVLGIVPKCDQSPSLESATLSLRDNGACVALGLRDEVVLDCVSVSTPSCPKLIKMSSCVHLVMGTSS